MWKMLAGMLVEAGIGRNNMASCYFQSDRLLIQRCYPAADWNNHLASSLVVEMKEEEEEAVVVEGTAEVVVGMAEIDN
jgi:hypothetical protein